MAPNDMTPQQAKRELKRKLRKLMEQRGWSPANLAAKTALGRNVVTDALNEGKGVPQAPTLERLLDALAPEDQDGLREDLISLRNRAAQRPGPVPPDPLFAARAPDGSLEAETAQLLSGAPAAHSPILIAIEDEDAPLTEAEFPRTARHLTVSLSTGDLDRIVSAAAEAERADVAGLIQAGRRIWEQLAAAQERLPELIRKVRGLGRDRCLSQPVAWCGHGELLARLRNAILLAHSEGEGVDGFLAVGAGAHYFTPMDSGGQPRTIRRRAQPAAVRVHRAESPTTAPAAADVLLAVGRTSLAGLVGELRADENASTRAVLAFTSEEGCAGTARESLDLLPFLGVGDRHLGDPDLLEALEAAVRAHGDRLAVPSIVTGLRILVARQAARGSDGPKLRQALTWTCWSWVGLPLFARTFGEVAPAAFPHLMDLRGIVSGAYYDRSVGEKRYSVAKLDMPKEPFHLYLSGAGGTGKSCFLRHLYEEISKQADRVAVWYRVDAPNSAWDDVQRRIRSETVQAIRHKLQKMDVDSADPFLSEANGIGTFLRETVSRLCRSGHGISEVVIFIDQLERTFESGDEPDSGRLAEVSEKLVALLETVQADQGVRVFIASRKQYLPDFLGSSAKAGRSRLEFNVLQPISNVVERRGFVERIVSWCCDQQLVHSRLRVPDDVAQSLVEKVDGHPLNTALALVHLLSQDVSGELSAQDLKRHRPWEHLFDLDLVAAARDDLDWYFLLAMAHARTEIVRVEEVWWRLRLVHPKLALLADDLQMTGIVERLWMLGTLGRTVHVRSGGARTGLAGDARFVEFFHANLRDYLLREVMGQDGADIQGLGRPGGTPAAWRALDRLALYAHGWEHTQQLLPAEDVQALMDHRDVAVQRVESPGAERGRKSDAKDALPFELLFVRQDRDERRELAKRAMECFVFSALVHDNLGRWAFGTLFPEETERIDLCRDWLQRCSAESRPGVLRYLIELGSRGAHQLLADTVLDEANPQAGPVRRAVAEILAEPLYAARYRQAVLNDFLESALLQVRGEPSRLPQSAVSFIVHACNRDRNDLARSLAISAESLKRSRDRYVHEHAGELVAPDRVDDWLARATTDGAVRSPAPKTRGGRPAPLGLALGANLEGEVTPKKIAEWSDELRRRIGTPLPDLCLIPAECGPDEAELRIRGLRVSTGLFPRGHLQLAKRRWQQLRATGLPEPLMDLDDSTDEMLVWLPADQARELGLTGAAKDSQSTLVDWLEAHCRFNFDRLFDRGLTMDLVRELAETTADSPRNGFGMSLPLALVREITVNLVEEGVRLQSGRDGLLTELWRLQELGRGSHPADFLEQIRRQQFLQADVYRSALGDSTRLNIITLERGWEARLGDPARQHGEPSLTADPVLRQQLTDAIHHHIVTRALPDDDRSYPVLVTGPQLRYPLARLLRPVDRRLRVLSFLELRQDIAWVYGGAVALAATV
ncbi:FHIPEP family type III secretion protein [Streptomyces sp. NPDC058755]|uniref:FHIPEP family type III secretion protein n=1 Tax=Streptomyces sp. NPDC058755 TaxID=3346624 RepID=UPI00368DD964